MSQVNNFYACMLVLSSPSYEFVWSIPRVPCIILWCSAINFLAIFNSFPFNLNDLKVDKENLSLSGVMTEQYNSGKSVVQKMEARKKVQFFFLFFFKKKTNFGLTEKTGWISRLKLSKELQVKVWGHLVSRKHSLSDLIRGSQFLRRMILHQFSFSLPEFHSNSLCILVCSLIWARVVSGKLSSLLISSFKVFQ